MGRHDCFCWNGTHPAENLIGEHKKGDSLVLRCALGEWQFCAVLQEVHCMDKNEDGENCCALCVCMECSTWTWTPL